MNSCKGEKATLSEHGCHSIQCTACSRGWGAVQEKSLKSQQGTESGNSCCTLSPWPNLHHIDGGLKWMLLETAVMFLWYSSPLFRVVTGCSHALHSDGGYVASFGGLYRMRTSCICTGQLSFPPCTCALRLVSLNIPLEILSPCNSLSTKKGRIQVYTWISNYFSVIHLPHLW